MTQSEPRQKPEAEATSRKLVRSSQAIVRWVGDVLQITTPGSDRNVETEGLLILRILGEFSQPALAKDVVAKFPKTNPQTLYEAIDHLVGAGILLEHCEELAPAAATSNTPATSRKTLTVPAELPIGLRCSFDMLAQKKTVGGLAIIGAPSEIGARGDSGARHGPRLIRRCFPLSVALASSTGAKADPFQAAATMESAVTQFIDFDGRRRFAADALPILDLGNVVFCWDDNLPVFGERLSQVVSGVLEHEMVPIVLGGDHSISQFPLQAIANRHQEFGIIHFDAHSDLYDSEDPQMLTHANFLVKVLACKSLRRLHQIGLRGFDFVRAKQQLHTDPRISYVSAREARRKRPSEVFEALPRELPYYLTFDIDCISPQLAAETGTPVIGGLDYYDALELIDFAGRNFRIIGADFTEVALHPDRAQWAARATAQFLAVLLMTFLKPLPLDSYLTTGLATQ